MWHSRSFVLGAGAAVLLLLASCVDEGPLDPAQDGDLFFPTPSAVVIDGANGGSPDFFFLPPLVNNPTISGTFSPDLMPTMRVCMLDAEVPEDFLCPSEGLTAEFGEGSALVGDNQYHIAWDTDGDETTEFVTTSFYRLEILVGGTVMGSIDLDPQDPEGPGQGAPGYYAFRVGENIPVKFWLSTDALCAPTLGVLECTTGTVVDETRTTLELENDGARLSVELYEGALPGENAEPITIVVERLDPILFAQYNNEECIPFFDAPQFGPCFRITTYPELTAPLDRDAVVSICLDPGALPNLAEGQEAQIQMVRFASDGSGDLQALPKTLTDCPTESASLITVPERGLFRYAALGVNAFARFVGPQPLAAHGDIRLGGLTSSFSRFRFALPGQMTVTDGDGTILQNDDGKIVPTEITVLDHEGLPVANAVVHFSTEDGTIDVADVVTDGNGIAKVQWTVSGTAGVKTLTAKATGLMSGDVPDHDTKYLFFEESVDVKVTVVGPPATLAATPTVALSGTAGEIVDADPSSSEADPVSIMVKDAGGNNVVGADVTWTASGTGSDVSGDAKTGSDGTASAAWELATTAGGSTLTVTVGTQTHMFTATGAAGPAVPFVYSGDVLSAHAGSTLTDALVVKSADQYGNPRQGDPVTWAVPLGGGELSEVITETLADGTASAMWTLGDLVGDNMVTAEFVEGFPTGFTATGTVGPVVQPEASGISASGTVGKSLGDLSITVADVNGNPHVGYEVTWVGDGMLSTTTFTDEFGVATIAWTLDTGAGEQTVTASGADFESVPFTTEAKPDVAATLTIVGGNGQSARVGATLTNALSVVVTDMHGNESHGAEVTWNTSGGTIDAPTASGGAASAMWTLGATPGQYTATAAVGTLLDVTFNATATCLVGYGAAKVDGEYDPAEWACANDTTFTANISGGDTPAEVYWMNDADNLYIAVRVFQSSLAKANSLLIDFDNDGKDGIALNDDAIGYDADKGSFIDRHVTRKCLNSSQSGCGADDDVANGRGAADTDGTWTTYELSHPLTGDGEGEDIVVATGDKLGFFVTLRVGKGAQGNTQFPGFRNFLIMTIKGLSQ